MSTDRQAASEYAALAGSALREAATSAREAATAAREAAETAGEVKRDRQLVEHLTPDPHKQMVQALATSEGAAMLRIGPRRNRWRDLARFDEQLAELEQRQDELLRETNAATVALANEPERHAAALAGWFENGQRGARPESRTAALEREIADLRAEYQALGIRHNQLLAERVDHVVKHRPRLLEDVRKEKDTAAREYAELVDRLEEKRQELLDWRATEVWVNVYPSPTLTSQPNTDPLVGAKRSLQEPHLPGLRSGLVASAVFNLLRSDAGFCSSVATLEQAAVEHGVTAAQLSARDARWIDPAQADLVGPTFDAAWGGSAEEKAQADRIAAYQEATRRRLESGWGD